MPFSDRQSTFRAGKLGIGLFLVSLGMLFAASLAGFVVIRLELGQRGLWPNDLPSLPHGLWLSTFTLVVSSITMQWALHSVRAGRLAQLQAGMMATTLLGFCFLVVQSRCWLVWLEPVWQRWHQSNEYRYALTSFYILTGLHALHVMGGLIPLTIVTRNAFRGDYSSSFFPGVQYCAMYWHFLDAVWIVLFATLLIGL